MDEDALDVDTLAVQSGLKVRVGDVLSTVGPIDASTTFTYPSVSEVHAALTAEGSGFAYARNANPTVVSFEQAMARLEGADEVVAFGSGMAAIHGALIGMGLENGDMVLAGSDLYGVTRSLLVQLSAFGIETHFVDILDLEIVERSLKELRPRVLYFESVSNPLLRVPDVQALATVARTVRTATMVDNTFATPCLLRPLELGVNVVVHSATKYIAGHGDVIAGLVACDQSYGRRIRDIRTLTGGVLSPFEAWLAIRGMRTLHVRLARQSESALSIASWLSAQPWVQKVHYPGLDSHPQHALAGRQFGGRYGGMVAVDLCAGEEGTLQFIDALQIVTPGTTLGDTHSLVLYPRLSSHRTLSQTELEEAGIGEGLVRISVGLESPRDLIRDLERAALSAHIEAAGSAVPTGAPSH